MFVLNNFIKYFRLNSFYFIYPVIFVAASIVQILMNGSFIFEYEFLNKFGDQKLYYDLAYNIAHGNFPKSPYTLGYSLFYLPFIFITGIKQNWEAIMIPIISIQAFILVPVTIFLLFINKGKKVALFVFGILVIYFLLFLRTSEDRLIGFNFFGLIPLSEPLAVFLLISSYHVYLKYLKISHYKIFYLIIFSFLFAWSLLTRNTIIILYLPIFLDMLLDNKHKNLFLITTVSFLFYTPQLIYNYLCSGNLFFNGYVWWANNSIIKTMRTIKALYGVESSKMFSVEYLKINIHELFFQYMPLIALSIFNYLNKNRFTLLVLLFTLINLVFHLAYWWSKAGGLIHRFLMPNVFLLLFIFRNNLLTRKNE